ncbi:lytic polysaccharide monooxygenase [Paenibacillus sp. L3-i20]|uniref:lytic polysaccharide monooxygenase n=1 Tax=Paenibacillus sp. L3-i20 TaxID=2905833 RepID=UPI001EE10323|nr:lytic polysaccharide monooxygenase [Paenibacillus sp. L3-i20]GKU79970.1 chitin-binding protein [Paenibacillus sp. L3-i20]
MTTKAIRSSRSTVKQFVMYMGILLVAAVACTLFAQQISAHGYVEGPASRAALCKSGQNTNCGPIIYEPQSLEAAKGFPNAGPADGQIASANGAFPTLDEQSATRWSKVNITAGQRTFTWKLTAAHATASWKYYITKTNWNSNAALTRNSFDLTPFCSVNYGGAQPPFSYSNSCNVPARTGYHVILAVWEVADTPNAFYNVIDVNFSGSNPSDTQAPTAPSSLTSPSKTATSVSLSWGASTDNVGVTGYRIYRGSTLVATVTGTTLSYNNVALTSNTTYTYSIKAIDSAGNESGSSNSISVTTSPFTGNDTQAPTAPGALHVMGTPTSTSLQLMWNASTDNVAVTGYRVYRGTTLVATVAANATSYTVTGLTASTSYTFNVHAIDGAGNQSAASTVSATTAGTTSAIPWAANVSYAPGTLVSYNGLVYECRQSHTSVVGWEPPNVASLWLLK